MSRLSESDVREIKALLRAGELNQGQIGKRFGVGNVIICQIKTGKRWAHIE